MITELYIDNFRCLVNFEISLARNQLWLGANGTGKSSVLDVMRSLRNMMTGGDVGDNFPTDGLTKWQSKCEQVFRVTAQLGTDRYDYQLVVEHGRKDLPCRIRSEQLTWNSRVFYRFDGHEAHLYRINRRNNAVEEGVQFSADWNRSVIPTIAERDDNKPLTRFREYVARWLIVQPIPTAMKPVAEKESRFLHANAQNFADWYRHVHQEMSEIGFTTREDLRRVLDGFQVLNLKESGDVRKLIAMFRANEKDFDVSFDRLSDGQRQLITLYVILNALKTSLSVVFIDEPDNFISAREIQPWLSELRQACTEAGPNSDAPDRQAIIISHHPETVNVMTDGTELWFHRPQGSHTVVKPYPVHEGLTPSETLARGWENE